MNRGYEGHIAWVTFISERLCQGRRRGTDYSVGLQKAKIETKTGSHKDSDAPLKRVVIISSSME